MTNKVHHAWFSQQNYDMRTFGFDGNRHSIAAIWLDLHGKEVVATYITNDLDAKGYGWEDKKYLGEVTKFVRTVY